LNDSAENTGETQPLIRGYQADAGLFPIGYGLVMY
jgi:hypothetical protein